MGDDSSLLPVVFVVLLSHIELTFLLLIAVKFPVNRTPNVCCMAYTTAKTNLALFEHTSCTEFSSAMVVFVWMNTGVGSVVVIPVKLVMSGVAVVLVVVPLVVSRGAVVVTPAKLVVSGVAVVVLVVAVVLDGILVVLGAVCVSEELVWLEEVANAELAVDVAYRVHTPSDAR